MLHWPKSFHPQECTGPSPRAAPDVTRIVATAAIAGLEAAIRFALMNKVRANVLIRFFML
jgi:hypothetical protein